MSQDTPDKKGHPTPKRKDAEAKRVVNSLAPASNRAERQAQKALVRQARGANRAAYMRGEESALPARDRGPVRKFVRNFVDSRRSVAEYLLPLLFVVLIVSRSPKFQMIAIYLMYLVFLGAIAEGFILTRRIKREVATRFPDAPTKGLGMYGWSRSTQLRRLRAPSPQVKAGDKLP